MINRQITANFDWKPFLIIFIIFAIGISSIYSVTSNKIILKGETPLYLKQFYWMIIGFGIFLSVLFIDYHQIARYAYFLYLIVLGFLLIVFFYGQFGGGAKRWISLGLFSFQPSEMAKIALILTLGKYFSENLLIKNNQKLKLFFYSGLFLLPYFILILKQPDLGTAIFLILIFFAQVLIIGVSSKNTVIIILLIFSISLFSGKYFWGLLKDYQKQRIVIFLNPSLDPKGKGYHLLQSKISVGSGQLTGKGFFGGTQSKLKFLPASHTDFIFAVYAEQWGFVGVFVLFLLYFLLILWGIDVAFNAKDLLGIFISMGVVSMLAFHVFVNIGMNLGVMPVVGIPLPFMSYGGTSIITNMIGVGLLMNIKMRRFMFY